MDLFTLLSSSFVSLLGSKVKVVGENRLPWYARNLASSLDNCSKPVSIIENEEVIKEGRLLHSHHWQRSAGKNK